MGFRYTACYLARPLGLTGWVRNLWDGTVEMEVQGPGEVIEKFLEQLQRGRFIRIEGMDTENIPLERESDFTERW